MTDLETLLSEMQARAEKATPGPWLNGYPNACKVTPMPDHVWSGDKELIAKELIPEDASFIAASRTDVPRLIAALRVALTTANPLLCKMVLAALKGEKA